MKLVDIVGKRILRKYFILFVIPIIFSQLCLGEYRSPSLLERGPMRVLLGEDDGEYGLTVWGVGYSKIADKAYTSDHGTTTEPLPALWFNKSDFRLTEIFPDSLVPLRSEFHHPLLRTTNLHLRAQYTEQGISVGLRYDYPFYHDNGRLGLRVHVPVKRVKINKIDVEGVRSGGEFQDVFVKQPVVNTVQGGSVQNQDTSELAIAIRLDFAESLVQASDKTSAIRYNINNRMQIGANAVDNFNWSGNSALERNIYWTVESGESASSRKGPVLAVYSPEGYVPRNPDAEIVLRTDAGANAAIPFPEDGNISAGNVYYFDSTKDYKLLADDHAQVDLERRLQNQATKANIWLIPIQRTANDIPAVQEGGTLKIVERLINKVQGNAYEWMHDRGMDFELFTAEGIGDIDAEAFYEHTFNDDLVAEFSLGVKIPTAKKSEYVTGTNSDRDISNPYRVPLGNNGHWEVKGGGMASWQPNSYFGLKGEMYYSMVLEEEEERAASFKNAQIKNLGPQAAAAVDWGYFVARVDFNVTHPKTTDIKGVVGYEFMYKREEDVRFTKTKIESWLGKEYDLSTGLFDTVTYDLDNDLSSMHTNAISHRIRGEVSWVLSDWVESFWGGAWTFAGKNTPREFDMHLGFHVAF
ncbi:hypothetical protein ACFLY6_00640 [Candidatus Dependentiae bacterium]